MKGLVLISGGIDSPVAAYLMKQKMDIEAVYFDNRPFSGEDTLERTKKSAKKVGLKELIVVPHGHALQAYASNCESKYLCVFCKRMMLKDAQSLAYKRGCDCLIMGDNLAQVASQTLQNLKTVSSIIKIPVVRPLISYDKQEIISLAKKIGTYDISTAPATCCTAVPDKPATKSDADKMKEEEAKIDVITLSRFALDNIEIIKL